MQQVIRRGVLAFCLVLAVAVTAFAQETPKPEEKKDTDVVDVSGNWDLTIETQQGPMTVGLMFKMDKEKLTGALKSPQGDMELAGSVTSKEMKFVGTYNGQNGALEITFVGTPGKEKLSGTVDFGGRGSGSWSAVRPKQ
jgi:hypothetical protein